MKGLSRVEWILGILLVVLLGTVMVLVLLIWFQPQGGNFASAQNSATVIASHADDIAPTPADPGQSARIAYAAAQQVARRWQSDAVLLNATGSWPQGADVLLLASGQTAWRFTFYSEQAGQAAFISVENNQAALLSTSVYSQPNPPVSAVAWNVDSFTAVDIFLEAGGRDFLNQEGITVFNMFLQAANPNGNNQLEWTLSLLSPGSSRGLEMTIDATSGQIMTGP